jgi:hypothetical protein
MDNIDTSTCSNSIRTSPAFALEMVRSQLLG